MGDVNIKSMIYYEKEDDKGRYQYKAVDAINPSDVKYEEGMLSFKFIRYFTVKVDDKEYYVIISKSNESYAFGTSETLRNLISRAENGEKFDGYERDLIEEYISRNGEDYTFWITGRKVLRFDYIKNKVPTKIIHINTSDLDLHEDEMIDAKTEWYVEYKKIGDDKWYIKPTFCSDKKFRDDPSIKQYRFVKAAVYEINGVSYHNVIAREDKIYENVHEIKNRDEIDAAIDAAKLLIYGEDKNPEMFAGYTRIYPFNTEDASSVFRLQEDKIKDQDTLTVTGSGDTLLDLFMYGAKTVTCFDINILAKFYALLKISFIKAGMSYSEFDRFFLGERELILNKDIYDKYSSFLNENLKRFWDGIYEYLNTNNKNLVNSSHNLFYKIYDFFGTANRSYRNNSSYFGTEANYVRLQETLKSKSLSDINFVDCSLFDLPEKLAGKQYGYAYLSNILDFTELYYDNPEELDRKIAFREFILNNLSNIITEDGLIDVGFIAKHWQIGSTYANSTLAFNESAGFTIRDLNPYNKEDKVIVFNNKKLNLGEGHSFK